MLNEFKRPMWSDGPAKQPWLNYFNEYERTHCCFGEDGSSDVGDADDIAFNTSSKAARDASTEQSSGMSADQAQAVSDAIDEAEKAGASNTQMQNIAEGGNRAAQAGYTGAELGTVAAANIDVNFFDETDKGPGARGVGSGSISGYGSFADPFSDSGVGQTSFKSFSEDLGGAISGAAGVVSEALQGMYSMTPSGLMMGMATGKGPGGAMTRSALGRDYDAPLSGLAGLFSSKRGDPEFEAFSKEVAAKNEEYEKARQAAEEEKNMGNITNEEYMDIIDEINKSKSSITGPSGLEGFGGPTLADYEEARQAAIADASRRDALERSSSRNNPFTIPLNKGGVVYRDGGGTTSEDDKPFEFSMADYFKNQKTAPFYSTKPNEYLVALQRQIYPDITTDEIYRRLGYRPAPDPDDTSSTTSYYNNPYGMNI